MSNLTKRTRVHFEPNTYQALSVRAASSGVSISEVVDEAVRQLLIQEDHEDLADITARMEEPEISFQQLRSELVESGKI
jgi:plasmid stability protein